MNVDDLSGRVLVDTNGLINSPQVCALYEDNAVNTTRRSSDSGMGSAPKNTRKKAPKLLYLYVSPERKSSTTPQSSPMPKLFPKLPLALAFLLSLSGWIETARADAKNLDIPPGARPVEVRTSFHLLDLQRIDDEAETFEFSGVLTLVWKDSRQAFDSAQEGVTEKLYHGAYQFDELSPSWYPQVILANASQIPETQGILLRVSPDGTCTLIQDLHAIAREELNLRRYPFDHQHLKAVFQVLGFNHGEVRLTGDPQPVTAETSRISVPQWRLESVGGSFSDLSAPYLGKERQASALIMSLKVKRQSFFVVRLVMIPLWIIVGLSWCVFWMDRASLVDRMNVSFVGLLTAVAFQSMISEFMPHISYVTFINSFVSLSFLLMSATAAINLVVCLCDRHGHLEKGDVIDRRCRWMFPVTHVSLVLIAYLILFLFY